MNTSIEITKGRLPLSEALNFITSGHALFTLKSSKTGSRFTFRADCKHGEKQEEASLLFVKLLTGSNNESDYQYFGYLRKQPDGSWNYQHGKKTRITPEAPGAQAFSFCFSHVFMPGLERDDLEFWHEGCCGRCGRLLTDPESVERGIGPECIKRKSKAKRRKAAEA